MVTARLMSAGLLHADPRGPIVAWKRGSSNLEGSWKRWVALRPTTLMELWQRRCGMDDSSSKYTGYVTNRRS